MRFAIFVFAALSTLLAADYEADRKFIAHAKAKLSSVDEASIRSRINEKTLPTGGVISYLGDWLVAIQSDKQPTLLIDDTRLGPMRAIKGSKLWIHLATVTTGNSHAVSFLIDGKPLTAPGQTNAIRKDFSAYTSDSYPKEGVPHGTLSEKMTHTSKIYPGMVSDFWVYASPGVDPNVPAPVMVWQDGQNYANINGGTRLVWVTDNLIAQKKLPPMIHVMVAPGFVDKQAMRRIEYDTMSDRYTRFILDEIFPIVQQKYKLRTDAYSRAIGGESSGGICSLVTAWFRPDDFSRVLSRIGSYTSIEWNGAGPDPNKDLDGGNLFPFLVRKSKVKKNIRIWMSDGYEDLENEHGSWPLQNLQLANSLKRQEYDFHLHWGTNAHNTQQGNAELPFALTWLWRDYDTAKTTQEFTMDPAEKSKPFFRVRTLNRDDVIAP